MSEILFTESDYARMERKSVELLGWSLSTKCGMTIKEMVNDPVKAKQSITTAKERAGFIDRIKLKKLLSLMEDENWKQKLKKALS
jgi:hypothetical protein